MSPVVDGPLVAIVESLPDVKVSRRPMTRATGSFQPLCPWPRWGLRGAVGNGWCALGSNLLLVLDGPFVLGAECVGAAAAKPLPRPRAARPRTPAMALEAVSFLTVPKVFMNSLAFQVLCGLADRLDSKGMALTNTQASGERCVLAQTHLVQML